MAELTPRLTEIARLLTCASDDETDQARELVERARAKRGRPCDQHCGADATVYAIDPVPGGWGGRYCEPCVEALGFNVTDRF